MGNTVAICRECLLDALKSTESYKEEVKAKSIPKPLFPHPELDNNEVTLSSVADVEPKPIEVIEDAVEEFPISVSEDTVTNNPGDVKPTTPNKEPKAKAKSNKKKPNNKK